MKLYLLRHGQTEGSLLELYYGSANIPVVIDWAELAWQAVKAFVMVVVASIIPALITARQDPARSLRSM